MKADFSLDYDVLTMERPHQVYLMARFVAGSVSTKNKRRPLNISLVIDRSGSMAGAKIDYTRQAAQFLVQNLAPIDILSIVLYNDQVETLVEPGHVINKDAINHQIDKIRISGTTNLSGGWLQGCSHVAQKYKSDRLNRVILMSDGLANRGVTDPHQLINMSGKKLSQEQITTTTMGLGTDFNEDLMMSMANAGGGAFYFIESPEVAPSIFHEELRGLLNVVGQNLTISLVAGEHVVQVDQLNAYPKFKDRRVTSFRLGDVYADEEKNLVLELTIPALQSLGQQEIATLKFDYDELQGDGGSQHHTWEMPVVVNVQSSAPDNILRNPEVMENVLLLKAANARKRAIQEADKGKFKEATGVLRDAIAAIEQAEIDNPQLDEERIALESQADQLEMGETGYDNYSRKTMSTQAMYTLTSRHEETMVLRQRELQRAMENYQADHDANTDPSHSIRPPAPSPRDNIETPTHVTWENTTFELEGGIIRIGRSSHNEIQLARRGVSRFHAHIKRIDGKLILEDLGSTNGTHFKNKPLFGSLTLSVGDEISICDEKLIFHDGNWTV